MLPDALLGETEPRLFLERFDCWGVGDLRGFGGGLAGGDGLCLRLGGLAEGDILRVLRGGLDTVLLGGFFGGDRERDEEEEELLPDKDADDRLLLQIKYNIRQWLVSLGNVWAWAQNCICLQAHREPHTTAIPKHGGQPSTCGL